MNYLSVCSGIEAATCAWHSLGWNPIGFSEIEPFPCKVLAHHYPNVPNFGDMTKFKEWPDMDVDLLVGGTPCQSFSIAGLRKGLDDPRGNLMLTYLAIADRFKPSWVVFENVPGILSTHCGDDFAVFLDALEELGYIADVDIIDAQFCGLAQRRRRVFVCAQSRESLLKSKTITSALTISQCLAEILLLSLTVLKNQSATELKGLAFDATNAKHSLHRRMKLFSMEKEGQAQILAENLDVLHQLLDSELSVLESQAGKNLSGRKNIRTATEFLMSTAMQKELESTGLSWKQRLEEVLMIANECITSTPSSETTESKIFMCAQMALHISGLITQSLSFSPPFWSSVLSLSTTMKEFTNYARSANSDIFTESQWVCAWSVFLGQAERANQSLSDLRARNYGSDVFPIAESLRGNPPPSRNKGEEIAPTIRAGAANGGPGHGARSGDSKDELIVATYADVSLCLTKGSGQRYDYESETFALAGNTIGRAPKNGGNHTGYDDTGSSYTLTKQDRHAVAYRTNAAGQINDQGGVAACINTFTDQTAQFLHQQMRVRRLTPLECERLMGYPDGYTDIPGASNTARYKALGNSMAVNSMRILGERIEMAESIKCVS